VNPDREAYLVSERQWILELQGNNARELFSDRLFDRHQDAFSTDNLDELLHYAQDPWEEVRGWVLENPICPPMVKVWMGSEYRNTMPLEEFLQATML